jgi:50S ribosome-binding GTPase
MNFFNGLQRQETTSRTSRRLLGAADLNVPWCRFASDWRAGKRFDAVARLLDAARRLREMIGFSDHLRDAITQSLFGPVTDRPEIARRNAQATALVVWLLGKTGAGKTAIVAALTGDARAEVGLGFEPCTRTAAFYDVPSEAPLLRFLDTRGLGEAGYDPASDISWCEDQSHLVVVVMQVSDPVQQIVLQAVQQARRRHPEWPLVVVQSGLHRLYPARMAHPIPYPYTGGPEDETQASLPHALRQAIAYQRRLFDGRRGSCPSISPWQMTDIRPAITDSKPCRAFSARQVLLLLRRFIAHVPTWRVIVSGGRPVH